MKKIRSDLALPLLSAAAAFALYLILYAVFQIYPCGTKSIVWCDMEQQAVPLLLQLRQLAARGEGISYTALSAGGMQFYGIFFFFLSNPLSFLIFCTDVPADRLVCLLVLLKLALSAGTAAGWFRHFQPELTPYATVLLGVMYSCSGYGLFYYQNLMWLDVMAMLPLLMMGLHRLCRRADARLYAVSLCLVMLLCFYLSYMIVCFVLLYMALALRYLIPRARRGLIARRFLVASLLSALLTAFVWLPCFVQVLHSARGGSLTENLMQTYLLDHFGDKLCLIGCTAIGLAALPQLPARHRAFRMRLFGWLLAAVVLDPVNTMWQTGSYQAFPLRWGMIPILLLLSLAAEALAAPALPPRRLRRRTYLIPAGCALVLCIVLHCIADPLLYSYARSLWVSTPHALVMLLFLTAMTAAYYAVLCGLRVGGLPQRVGMLLLTGLLLVEFPLQFRCYMGAAANDDALYAQTMAVEGCYDDETGLDRVRLTKKYMHANMLGAAGMPSLAHYTSLTREDYLIGVKRMGYSSYWMEVPSTGGTVLSDALWHIRYQLGTRYDLPEWSVPVWTNGLFTLGENTLLPPTAIYAENLPETLSAGSRADVQRRLAAELGLGDILTDYPATTCTEVTLSQAADGTECTLRSGAAQGEIRFAMFVKGRQALYFDLSSQTGTELRHDYDGAVNVRMNGRLVTQDYPAQKENGLIFLGQAENEYVAVSVEVQQSFSCESFGVFGIDTEAVEQGLEQVQGEALTYAAGRYRAVLHPERGRTLLLPIAYDEGLIAEIDGKRAPLRRVNDCQCAVAIPDGAGELQLYFRVSGLRTGLLLGVLGLLLAAAGVWLRGQTAGLQRRAEKWCLLLMQAALPVLGVLLYALPLALWLIGTLRAFV